MEKHRLDIDFLRVLAFLLVFFLHIKIATAVLLPGISWWGPFFLFSTPAWAGVWIFIMISGFLAGRGFFSEKYKLSRNGVIGFWLQKIIVLGIPTWTFVFIEGLLLNPTFMTNYSALLRMLTFTYNGNPGATGMGAVWYISTVMQLFILAPLIFYFIRKAYSKHTSNLFWAVVTSVILLAGLLWRVLSLILDIDWYKYVYTLSLSNIDIFAAGMIVNIFSINKKKNSPIAAKILIPFLLAVLVIINCYLYFLGTESSMFIYQRVLPTVYAVLVILFLYVFTNPEPVKIRKTFFIRAVTFISGISFQMYLWHSAIMTAVKFIFLDKFSFDIMAVYAWQTHIAVALISFILTVPVAWFFTKAFNVILPELVSKVTRKIP